MTDTTPTPEAPAPHHGTWLDRLRDLLHHHDPDGRDDRHDRTKNAVGELLDKVHELEHRVLELEAAAVKDAPAVAKAVEEAATVVADVKAVGTP